MSGAMAIISDKQLGDVTLLEPAVRRLAARSGRPCALFVNEAFRPLIELMPHACWGPEAKGKFEESWTMSWSSRAALRAWRLPARRRVLVASKQKHVCWWHRLVFQQIIAEPPGPEYWARYFWSLAGQDSQEVFEPPQLRQPPEQWRSALLPEAPYLVVNPTAAWTRKFWPAESWRQLILQVMEITPLKVAVTGGGSEKEREHCAAITADMPEQVVNLCGRTNIREFLHVLSRAQAVLCIDGAASHLAQAMGVASVTLFGPTHDGKWHWPTPRHLCLAARAFLADGSHGSPAAIPVAAVLEAARQILPEPRSAA
jgi:ADP-heptose:LPS heptosyltransferase